jgi:endonuclease-3
MPRLPPGWDPGDLDDHHQLLKRLGQTICRADGSRCRICPLKDLCPSDQAHGIAFESSRRLRLQQTTEGGYS